MPQVSLKILVVEMKTTKTMQFSGDMSVHEACRDIREKLGEAGGGIDHSLYWPDHLKWLSPVKTLDYYDIKSGDGFEFKKRHRPIRIRMMDETLKTILIDETMIVSELVVAVCEKIGIANPEEYSLIADAPPLNPTGTVKKKNVKGSGKDDESDEGKWLNPEKTLAEQHIKDAEVLLLKKKFFFSDQNVDRNDPVQLNLLYNQSVSATVGGKHPCTMDEACLFAAIQCQVQFGNHAPDKHKPGFINLKEFVPAEYRKKKDMDKKIFHEHRKLQGMTELNAKFRYVQLCRSLKTYGVTFFEVKERALKKNKMEPILLGITRESVMRLDVETKDILKVWPLTTLRRWAAAPNSFTLDFGDYSDSYYSVQTQEGEAISQLIGGYIDIIMKKKKDVDRAYMDDEEEIAISEETIKSANATTINMQSSKMSHGMEMNLSRTGMVAAGAVKGQASASRNAHQRIQMGPTVVPQAGKYTVDIHGSQQALLHTIGGGFAAMTSANAELSMATMLPPSSADPATTAWRAQSRHINSEALLAHVASHLASACSIVLQSGVPPNDIDFSTLGADISSITTNISQFTSSAKMLAGLQDDDRKSEKLLQAAQNLSSATGRMLTGLQPIIIGEGSRPEFLATAQSIGTFALELLTQIEGYDVSPEAQKGLMEAAKAVAAATTVLVQSAKAVAQGTDAENQGQVIAAIKASAAMASQLVSCTGTVSPAISALVCQEKLMEAALMMQDTLEHLIRISGEHCSDAQIVAALQDSAVKVNTAIARLLELARQGGRPLPIGVALQYDMIVANSANVLGALDDPTSLLAAARDLAMSSSELVKNVRVSAGGENDVDLKNRLLGFARGLADATTKMAGAAKEVAKFQGEPERAARLKQAIENVQTAAADAAGPEGQAQLVQRLLAVSRAAHAAVTHLVTATKAAGPANSNPASQLALTHAAKRATEAAGNLAVAARICAAEPKEPSNQLRLIDAAKEIAAPGGSFVAAANAAFPSVGQEGAQIQLGVATSQAEEAINTLATVQELAEASSGGIGLDGALKTIRAALENLNQARKQGDGLQPLPYQTFESSQVEMSSATKTLGATIAQLVSAATQGNERYAGAAAGEISSALETLASGTKGFAATCGESGLRTRTLTAAAKVMEKSEVLINAGRESIEVPSDADLKRMLNLAARGVNEALSAIVDCLPGQRDIDNAIQAISAALKTLDERTAVAEVTTKSFQAVQNDLNTASTAMNVAMSNLVAASRGSLMDLQRGAKDLDTAFAKLASASTAVVHQQSDSGARSVVISQIKTVGFTCSKLLMSVKAVAADPNGPNLKNQLSLSAKSVGDALEHLLQACSANAPGQAEANAASRSLALAEAKLDTVNYPSHSRAGYSECLAQVHQGVDAVQEILAGAPSAGRSGDVGKICSAVSQVADSLHLVAEGAVRAAFLVGLSDPHTVPAVPGLIDQDRFAQASHELQEACEQLGESSNGQAQVLAVAGMIAKHTATLSMACKEASGNGNVNPVARQQFTNSAKQVAAATAGLVTSIKALATQPTPETREACKKSALPLLEAVNSLVAFSASPEFAPRPSVLPSTTLELQQSIVEEGRAALASSRDLVSTLRSLCSNPRSPQYQALLAAQSKAIGDSLRNLLEAMTAHAPGQRECDEAVEKINRNIADLDVAAVKAHSGKLGDDKNLDERVCRENLLTKVRGFFSMADVISRAAKSDSSSLGASVALMPNNFGMAATATIEMARATVDPTTKGKLLDDMKDVGENAILFLQACRVAGGGQQTPEVHAEMDKARDRLQSSIGKLQTTFEGAVEAASEYNKIVKEMEQSLYSLDLGNEAGAEGGKENLKGDVRMFPHHVEQVCEAASKHGDAVADVLAKKSELPPEKMAGLAGSTYMVVVQAVRGAVSSCADEKVRNGMLEAMRTLGAADVKLVDSIKMVQGRTDATSRQKISAAVREVSMATTRLIAAAREGTKGTKQCEEAAEAIGASSADLETSLIFAQAGQLDPLDSGETFGKYKDALLSATKELVNMTKMLLAAASSPEQMGQAASASVFTLQHFKDQAKKAATAITSSDKNTQQLLLSNAKKVSDSIQEMLAAGAKAAGKATVHPDSLQLREAAKNLANNLTVIFDTIKMVGDESSRGVRAIDGACADIDDMLVRLQQPAMGTALPEEVAGLAKHLATAAATLVSAQKQDDVIAGTTALRKELESLIRAGQAATEQAPEDRRKEMHRVLRQVSESVKSLLVCMKEGAGGKGRTEVQTAAKTVAGSVNDVVEAASALIPGGYVDSRDPNVIAERELLSAATAIEAAAKKLALLRPAEQPKAADEGLGFDGQILEAAKSIAMAAGALVRSATGVQREIVAKGRQGVPTGQVYHADSAWSEGLVSAAKEVVDGTRDLCEAANLAVKGENVSEQVMACATNVGAATVRLLTAATVRGGDLTSASQVRLRAAGKAVTNATDQLAQSAKAFAASDEGEVSVFGTIRGKAGQKALEMDAQVSVLKMEKELSKARNRLAGIRKSRYAERG